MFVQMKLALTINGPRQWSPSGPRCRQGSPLPSPVPVRSLTVPVRSPMVPVRSPMVPSVFSSPRALLSLLCPGPVPGLLGLAGQCKPTPSMQTHTVNASPQRQSVNANPHRQCKPTPSIRQCKPTPSMQTHTVIANPHRQCPWPAGPGWSKGGNRQKQDH